MSTEEGDKPASDDGSPQPVEVVKPTAPPPQEPDQFAGIAALARGIFEPIATAEVEKAEIANERHEREMAFMTKRLWAGLALILVVFFTVAALVFYAYSQGDTATALTVIGLAVSFIGGVGIGRGSKKGVFG